MNVFPTWTIATVLKVMTERRQFFVGPVYHRVVCPRVRNPPPSLLAAGTGRASATCPRTIFTSPASMTSRRELRSRSTILQLRVTRGLSAVAIRLADGDTESLARHGDRSRSHCLRALRCAHVIPDGIELTKFHCTARLCAHRLLPGPPCPALRLRRAEDGRDGGRGK